MSNITIRPDVNYYALLGVTSTASPKEIVKAYRKKILEVHLDKLAPGEDSDLCYKTIEAYRVLSNRKLRTKYDIQRDPSYKAQEKFVPAGFICYDVGQSQLSKRFLKNISDWKNEFDELHSKGDGVSDNYFECFSGLMGQVLEIEENESAKALKEKEEKFCCAVCDKEFSSETLHWEQVLQPYIEIFSCDSINNGLNEVLKYFEKLIGSTYFHWEPKTLPTSVLGLWESEEWSSLEECDGAIQNILNFLPPEEEFSDTDELIEYIEETFLSDSETNEEVYPEIACKILIFLLENQDDQNTVVERVQDCLFRDSLVDIMFLVSAMKNYLGCANEEWISLASEAVGNEQPEMAMLWTKVAIELNDSEEDNDYFNGTWYNLGMKLYKMDPILAHFCFLLQGYGDDDECAEEDWADLADDFCLKGDHFIAIEYYIHSKLYGKKKSRNNNEDSESEEENEPLEKLLEKSKAQLKKGDRSGASLYRTVYYSLKVKSLLAKLQQRNRDDAQSEYGYELDELIDLVQELDNRNPLEGFRIISSTWPKVFEICIPLHQGTISYLRRGKLTTTAFNLILGALHFLPDEDEEDEEEFEELQHELCKECNTMVCCTLKHSMQTSDFNCLADILEFISTAAESRCIPAAKEILQDLDQKGKKDLVEKSPHLKAMKYLIQGTVSKVQKNWLSAMNQYQEALLCSPEVMHRVLPCISKLSQDVEFHEAILSQVQNEVKELKECFDSEEYPEVETKSNRNSLLIGDVIPQFDYGYKNSISKIQPDPEMSMNQPPPPEEENAEPPPVETNTPEITLNKTEEAIGSGKNQGQLSAALSYIDLLKALPTYLQPGPLAMASSHFLRAMDETTDPGSLFAYKNAIMQMAESLLKIDRKTQATIQHGLTHKHMLSVLLSAHSKLSKAVRAASKTEEYEKSTSSEESNGSESESDYKSADSEVNSSEEDGEEGKNVLKRKKRKSIKRTPSTSSMNSKSPGTDLIKTSDAHLISRFLKNVVNFPKIEPLANIPTLNCSDLVYVETLGNSFLSQFCSEKAEQKSQSSKIPKHLYAYTHFVEVWKGRSQLTDFFNARRQAMEELLALKGWSFEDVENLMKYPLLNLTDDGWTSEYRTELIFPNPPKAFKSIYGFKIDYKTAKISFLLSKDKQTATTTGNLFDTRDIQEIFGNGIEPNDCSLSFDCPDSSLRSHPFKEAKFSVSNPNCESFQVPNFFLTLARSAMLLCNFCSGLEICAKSPFNMKTTDEGLLLRLEEHLQHILRPAQTRKEEDKESKLHPEFLDIPNRFWLNLTEIFEEEEEETESGINNFYIYKVGDVKAQVRMNTLILTLNGAKASLTPEAEFARDFSKHYDEIGQYFPELLRLKELAKISLICKKLKQILREKLQVLKQNGRAKDEQMRIACVCKSIRDLGIYLEEDEAKPKDTSANNNPFTNCTWFPASSCHNLYPDIYEVSAGVRINPEITYFPVSLPDDCISVNAKELLAKKKLSFIRR